MTLQEQIDRIAQALRMPNTTNVDPSQVFECVQSLRAAHDRVTQENKELHEELNNLKEELAENEGVIRVLRRHRYQAEADLASARSQEETK